MPTGVAGRWLVTLLGAIASGAAFGACTGSQIDERTAVRVNVERGTATTAEELAIPVGGRADDAFGSVTGYRIEDAPDEVSSSFITDLSALPDAVELTESVGLRFVSALSSPGTDAIVIALAFAPSEEDRVSMLTDALVDGVSGGNADRDHQRGRRTGRADRRRGLPPPASSSRWCSGRARTSHCCWSG